MEQWEGWRADLRRWGWQFWEGLRWGSRSGGLLLEGLPGARIPSLPGDGSEGYRGCAEEEDGTETKETICAGLEEGL